MEANANFKKTLLSYVDLTSLNDNDTEEVIKALCKKAMTSYGTVAAVCIYPAFVKTAIHFLKTLSPSPNEVGRGAGVRVSNTAASLTSIVKIATVANFPAGNEPLEKVLSSIQQSINDGAEEIDVVFPYSHYLHNEKRTAIHFIEQCKKTCSETILLKVILETGAFLNKKELAFACEDVINAGADFLKTSTGKIPIGATLEAAEILLHAIQKSKKPVGIKISGGVRTVEQVMEYLSLAQNIMGVDWVSPKTFRIGASQLVEEILRV